MRIQTEIRMYNGKIIDTTDRFLDNDRCPHNKFVAVEDCQYGCMYYLNDMPKQYHKRCEIGKI